MVQETSKRLSELVEQKMLKEKLERDLHAVETELQEKQPLLGSLRARLQEEKIDVERLERMSLVSLFYSVLGSREQQLEEQRQELLSAQLRYQRTRDQVEYLEREKDRLSRQLENLKDIESQYERVLSEKEKLIHQSNESVAKELLEIAEELARLRAELAEIREAIEAGNSVLSDLDQAIRSLQSAENWGTWDLLGGGFISTMAKHSRIDDARDSIHSVQAKLSRFERELADVKEQAQVQINIGEMMSFVDFFFDGLIVDWVVQSKIEDSLAQSENARGTITQAIKKLETLQERAQSRLHEIQEKRALLIKSA